MKRLLFGIIIVLILGACSQKTETTNIDDARHVYNIMVNAAKENRDLTNEEEKIIDEYTHQVKGDSTTDLDRSISAMQMNFYETLNSDGDEPVHFNQAKSLAKKYLN